MKFRVPSGMTNMRHETNMRDAGPQATCVGRHFDPFHLSGTNHKLELRWKPLRTNDVNMMRDYIPILTPFNIVIVWPLMGPKSKIFSPALKVLKHRRRPLGGLKTCSYEHNLYVKFKYFVLDVRTSYNFLLLC